MNKWLLWGGGGAVALVAGFLLLRGGAAAPASAPTTDAGYYPPIVYGGGTGTVATNNSGASTDNSIAQLIAGNLAVAQEQSSMNKYTSDNEKAIALAAYGTQQTIAMNDNSTMLALQSAANRTAIQQTLAAQVTTLSNSFGAKQGVGGSIGFDGDKINVDLHTKSKNAAGVWV